MTGLVPNLADRLRARFVQIYGERASECLERIYRLAERAEPPLRSRPQQLWDERDVALITYGDQIQAPGQRQGWEDAGSRAVATRKPTSRPAPCRRVSSSSVRVTISERGERGSSPADPIGPTSKSAPSR